LRAGGAWFLGCWGRGFPMFAAGVGFVGAFNGSGETWRPARLNFLCLWVFQIPFAWVLAKPLGLGPAGVFISVPAGFTLLTLLSWHLFRRGKWKTQKV